MLHIAGDPHNIAAILQILAAIGTVVALIGNSFRRAREHRS